MPAKSHKDHPYMMMPLHANKAALQDAQSGKSAEAWQGSIWY